MSGNRAPTSKESDDHGHLYAPVPLSLASDQRLSNAEVRLLVVLMCHDLPDQRNGGRRKGAVQVRRSRLAALLGIKELRHISKLLRSVEEKGLVSRIPIQGRASEIRLTIPDYPPVSTLAHKRQRDGQPLPVEDKGGLPMKDKGPLPIEDNQKIRNKIRTEEVPPASCPKDTQQRVTKAERARKTASSNQTDPRVSRLIVHFCTQYERIFGHRYTFSGGKDGATFKALLKDHTPETLQRCTILFLEDSDPWLNGKRTISVLRSRINQYVQLLTRDTADTSWDKEY